MEQKLFFLLHVKLNLPILKIVRKTAQIEFKAAFSDRKVNICAHIQENKI